MTFFTSIIFISIYRFIIVHGQNMDDNLLGLSSFSTSNDDWLSEEFTSRLNNFYPGNTVSFESLSDIITDSRTENDVYEVQFNPRITNFFDRQILIGQLGNINQIINIQMSFHNDNGDIIRDGFGNPITYISNRQDLGHVLDILHTGFSFAYVRCLLRLQSNSNFDPHSLFFHFSQRLPSRMPPDNTTYIITGPTSFSIDSNVQVYSVSAYCPFRLTCMWLLDNEVISSTPNTTVSLVFDQRDIGNRTLSYVGYLANTPRILASLSLSIILSSIRPAGPMSTPRVYFTVTYLQQSGYLMIVGGTADGLTTLSSIDIYDPFTGCYNVSSMNFPRSRHAAMYYNNSDTVLVIGGVQQNNVSISQSEIISISGAQLHSSMSQPRYFHEINIFNNSNILIVAGLTSNSILPFEIYNRNSLTFQQLAASHLRLLNLEGHSVTSLGSTGNLLIFGGFNGSSYSGVGFIYDGLNLTPAGNLSITELETKDEIPARAHHQATYIPQINAVLITGGDNGTYAFFNSYLYFPANKTFVPTAYMRMPRSFHKALLLSNGSVIIIGGAAGMFNYQPITPTNSVEMYNPFTRMFTYGPLLNAARYLHQATSFQDVVYVSGGIGGGGAILSSNEYLIF
ncbi:unnamed protein product [Rotaria sordida]|uniref:Uncharacterized protein n=1 Tax=Rotaria sordida TaxID=392033 RepID=A0A818VYW6_9BILA|nr:unnamed protein product [Rotaria sordida]